MEHLRDFGLDHHDSYVIDINEKFLKVRHLSSSTHTGQVTVFSFTLRECTVICCSYFCRKIHQAWILDSSFKSEFQQPHFQQQSVN